MSQNKPSVLSESFRFAGHGALKGAGLMTAAVFLADLFMRAASAPKISMEVAVPLMGVAMVAGAAGNLIAGLNSSIDRSLSDMKETIRSIPMPRR